MTVGGICGGTGHGERLSETKERRLIPDFAPEERDVIIERGKSVTFPCDPTMELVPPTFNYDVLRNLSAELHLTVKYSVHAIF